MNFLPYLIVFVGSGIGGALRHGVNQLISHEFGTKFPYGILTINVAGSLALGVIAGYFAFKGEPSQHWRLFLTVGICGGFTTFSTFTQDAFILLERGQVVLSGLYVFLSVTLSILCFFTALYAMRQIS